MDSAKHIKLQLIKFNLYGLFKNLKFFDPFLIYYLWQNGLDLTKIGLLVAIRELMIYIFEIPSGVFADKFGKKTELIICFLFYIAAFVMFFIGGSFLIFAFAYILFGLGEAFRTGTHKAMIMEFLDYHELQDSKAKVYGNTRSYSLVGSSISSIFAIILVLILPDLNLLFLISIIPYILDLILILSYPEYLNINENRGMTFKEFLKSITVVLYQTLLIKKSRKLLSDSAIYNAIFKAIKDYVQPILETFMIGIVLFTLFDAQENLEIVLGLTYALIFFLSSFASRYSYLILKKFERNNFLNFTWIITSVVFVALGVFVNKFYLVIVLFIFIYLLQNIRKPIMVGKIGDQFVGNSKASVLSVESQITSLSIVILAPSLGFIYDNFGPQYVFYSLAIISLIMFYVTKKEH